MTCPVDSTHFFCGIGGCAHGLEEAGYTPSVGLNHMQTAVDSHKMSFPNCWHDCADINNYDMRRLPRTRVAWGSPICKDSSPAGGNATPRRQPELDEMEETVAPAPAWERTRATAWDLLRAAEVVGYDVVFWENVVDFATRWGLFNSWLRVWDDLGFDPYVVSANAAHLGGGPDSVNPRARQSRDRLLGVMVRKGLPKPDLRVRPDCMCIECGPVNGIQHWTNPKARRIGRYGQQYHFVCPNRRCGHRRVQPVTEGWEGIIDWSLPSRYIHQGKPTKKYKPYPETTRRIISQALARNHARPEAERTPVGGHMIVHLGRNSGPRFEGQTLSTVTCTPNHALVGIADTVDDCTIRMLRPKETGVAQRFPVDIGEKIAGPVEDQYTQIGNAVSVNSAHWMGAKVLPVLT